MSGGDYGAVVFGDLGGVREVGKLRGVGVRNLGVLSWRSLGEVGSFRVVHIEIEEVGELREAEGFGGG